MGETGDTFQESITRNLTLNAGVNWLWTLTDRVLIQSVLSNRYTRTKREQTIIFVVQNQDFSTWENRTTLDTSLNIFIENSLQLNITARPSLSYNGETESPNIQDFRQFRWQLSAGLRYYFSRNLY